MASYGLERYLSFRAFGQHKSVMSGVIKPVFEDGEMSFISGLTAKSYGSFDEAIAEHNVFGLSHIQAGGDLRTDPTRSLQQLNARARELHGKDVSVKLLEFKVDNSRQVSMLLNEIMTSDKMDEVIFHDGEKFRVLAMTRGFGTSMQYMDPQKALDVAKDIGVSIPALADRRTKRSKSIFANKQMDFDTGFGKHTLAVFDPVDILNKTDAQAAQLYDMFGWGAIEDQIRSDFVTRYGVNPQKSHMIDALRALEANKAVLEVANSRFSGRAFSDVDDLFEFLGSQGAASDIQEILIKSKTLDGVAKTFDGKGIIKRSFIETLREKVRKDIRTAFNASPDQRDRITGSEGKKLLRYWDDLTKSLSTGEFNVRGGGFKLESLFGKDVLDLFKKIGYQGSLDDLFLQFKGNFPIMEDALFESFVSGTADILAPLSNVNAGSAAAQVAVKVAQGEDPSKLGFFTAEFQDGKFHAYSDVQSPALGERVISKKQVDTFLAEARSALDQLKRIAEETNTLKAGERVSMNADSRAYSIIQASLESALDGDNLETVEHSKQMLERLAEGKLPANELPTLIKRFGESFLRKRNGKPSPRVMLPHTIRAYATSSAWEIWRSGGERIPLIPGTAEISDEGKFIFADMDIALRYATHGGFDLDDAFNLAFRKDGTGEGYFEALVYRQPNTSTEVSKIKIVNVHRSRALKNILSRGSSDFEARLKVLEQASDQVYRALDSADESTRIEDLIGVFRATPGRTAINQAGEEVLVGQQLDVLSSDEYQKLQRLLRGGSIEEVRQFLDVDVTTRLMREHVGALESVREDELISRNMPGARWREKNAAGKVRFPGVGLEIGEGNARQFIEFEFDRLGRATEKVELNNISQMVQELDNPGILGRWVNSKTSLGMFLEVNKEALQQITDPKLVRRVAEMLTGQIEEEAVIDLFIQGGAVSAEEIKQANETIERNWRLQAEIALETDLKMDDYFIENMPKTGQLGNLRRQILMDKDANLGEGIQGYSLRNLTELTEESRDLAYTTRLESFKNVEVSEDVATYAKAVERELDEIGSQLRLSEDQIKGWREVTLERRFFGSFEAGRFDRRSAELLVALSRGRYGALLSNTVETAGMETLSVLEEGWKQGGETLDTYARRRGRYVAPTEEFRMRIKDLGFDLDTLDEIGERARKLAGVDASEVISYSVDDAEYLFDQQGRLLPQSMIPMGDGAYEELGSIATAKTQMKYAKVTDLWELAARLSRSASQAVGQMPAAEAATSTPRPAFEAASRGANLKRGGMIQELLGHLSPRTRAIGVAAAAAVGASMIYNSVRDREYTKDKIGPPQTVDDPYHQDLALSPANAARVSQQFGTTYDIRTRGGNFGDDFLQTLADFTGGDVYASAYRDPYSDMTLEQTVGGSYR